MADAPPWPNFSLLQYYFVLLCPIIIVHLLALLPSCVHDLARCSCIRQHVSLLHHLQVRKHYPPPRKKKVRPRLHPILATPRGTQFDGGGCGNTNTSPNRFCCGVVLIYNELSGQNVLPSGSLQDDWALLRTLPVSSLCCSRRRTIRCKHCPF